MYIAEIGWNFLGDIELANKMVAAAAKSGATHVKFQYWCVDKLKDGEWDNDGRREIYEKAELNKDKIRQLIDIATEHNVEAFFSVFDVRDAKDILDIGSDIIKIPSHEISNIELIEFCCKNFDLVLISAGACSEAELLKLKEVVDALGCSGKICVMHCVSSYPCPNENANIPRLQTLKTLFNKADLGLSDHTGSVVVPAVAAAYGATVIEKHFTVDHSLPGRDNKFALLPDEFAQMVAFHKEAMSALIFKGVGFQECERATVEYYRGRWSK